MSKKLTRVPEQEPYGRGDDEEVEVPYEERAVHLTAK